MLTGPLVEEFGGSSDKADMLHGMYGPTEAAIHCTLAKRVRTNMKPSIIGEPLETVSAFVVSPVSVVDPAASLPQVVPIGHVGELAVGGHQLAQCYLNDPAKTAQAFVMHPKYGRLYRTGDKARMLPDGNLEILGRMKTGQVKLRGQRVELGEVEEAALKTPGLHAVSSTVIDGILIVFGLLGDHEVSEDMVLQVCRRWLPSFMVPGDVVLLKEFPRLVSGKVDKKLLDQFYEKRKATMGSDSSSSAEVAWDTTQTAIRDVLSRLSEVPQERIAVTSTIYQLGIDSLAAVHVASRLRLQGLEVTVGDVLEVGLLSSILRCVHD
jgi:acyl-CoA synthetase (AMP-forming)/AMP-acid ligase II/aryl carrier-like protein